MAEKTFTVAGIHCAGCESAIEAGLGRVDGVRLVKANHEAQTVTVRYSPQRLDEASLADALARIAYAPVESG
jgi:Cu+-exporting ATPase